MLSIIWHDHIFKEITAKIPLENRMTTAEEIANMTVFFWKFVHNLDPILIPHLRKAFNLTDLESSLIDPPVFIAYFVMPLPAGYIMRKLL